MLKRKPIGFLTGTVFFIFLSLLMIALVAKIIFMGLDGYNIIPLFAVISMICSFRLLKN